MRAGKWVEGGCEDKHEEVTHHATLFGNIESNARSEEV